jgi:hypothetical protein
MKALIAAILWLAPYIGQHRADTYARMIHAHGKRADIDGMLIVALTHKESRFRRWAYKSKNYGLMQVRVSASVNADLIGRERLLFVPRINFSRGMRLARMWKRYHEKHCGNDAGHYWHSHYQHGRHVSDPGSGERVRALYRKLVSRFRPDDRTYASL